MKEILLLILAYTLIWAAAGVNRIGPSNIKPLSKWWFVQFVLILVGIMIARYAYGL
jgi:hypothetical protein